MNEPPPPNFQLPRDTRTYDSSTKLEDWLTNYVTTVNVVGGNRWWAVRYVPQIVERPARISLNNQPEGSIICWLDFEEQFISNFTSTYKRPNHPQQLAMCRQGENETNIDYLTRWCTLRNSCEGVLHY
jgi:hypothetical protein